MFIEESIFSIKALILKIDFFPFPRNKLEKKETATEDGCTSNFS